MSEDSVVTGAAAWPAARKGGIWAAGGPVIGPGGTICCTSSARPTGRSGTRSAWGGALAPLASPSLSGPLVLLGTMSGVVAVSGA